ncbi:MAG: serine hydrolase [Caldisericota bacterium]|nr:serine hydrolase [Caldisericota bacterium]
MTQERGQRFVPVRKALAALLASVSWPVAVQALTVGQGQCIIFSHDADVTFGAASLVKLPVLICAAQMVEERQMSWDQPIAVNVPPPHGNGLLEHVHAGHSWTLDELCIFMMGVSDNLACNQLIDHMGMTRINGVLADLGYHSTAVRRLMMDHVALARGVDNAVTAAETADMLARLHAGTLVSPAASSAVLGYLAMNQLHDLLAWPLPGSVSLAGKTAGMPGLLLDAELITVTPGGPAYVLCVFASGFERALQAKRLMVDISEVVYQAVSEKPAARS